MKKQFSAPWDILLISMTTLVSLLLVAVAIYVNSVVTYIIFMILIAVGLFFGVYGYNLRDKELRIIRLGWSKDIPYKDIQDIEYSPGAMRGSLRLFGIGGYFSYCGGFKNRRLGHYKAYATHRKKTVIITNQKGEKIVVSPSSSELFVETLKSASEIAT